MVDLGLSGGANAVWVAQRFCRLKVFKQADLSVENRVLGAAGPKLKTARRDLTTESVGWQKPYLIRI